MMEIWVLLSAATLIGLYPIIYNLYFHPLRGFPGPRMAGATTWWKAYKEVFQQKTLALLLFDLHEKHGDIEKSMLMKCPNAFCRRDCANRSK
jgi:hypothetical protein